VFCFSLKLLSETFLIIRRTERDVIKNVHRYSCEVQLLLSDFNAIWVFSTDFGKKKIYISYQIPWKSSQCEPSCSMRTDGQTDMTKSKGDFRSFAKAHNKMNTVRCFSVWTVCLKPLCGTLPN
jgi:hypothetical protein